MQLNVPTAQISQVSHSNQNAAIEAVFLAIIAALFFLFLLNPKISELSQKNQVLAGLTQEYERLEGDKRTMESLIETLKSSPANVAKLDEALPLHFRITQMHIMLEEVARMSGMSLGGVNVGISADALAAGNKAVLEEPYRQDRTLQTVRATINVLGTMEQFKIFLQQLENNARVTDISSMEVSSSKDNSLNFSLTLQTYFYE